MQKLTKQTRHLILFYVIGLATAMLCYSGGHYLDSDTVGYSLSKNFISDLLRTTSHSGANNLPSLIISVISFIALLIALFRFLFLAADIFKKDFHNLVSLTKISAIWGCSCIFGVMVTPADVPSLYGLHVLFANSIFYSSVVTLTCYAYLFSKKDMKSYTIALLLCTVAAIGYIIIIEYGPAPWMSMNALILQVSSQKIITLSLVSTVFYMTKGIDLLNDKIQ